MRESYVRPVVSGREPLPRWIAIWRFRLLSLLLLAVLALVTIEVIQLVQGAGRQDPGVSDSVPGNEEDPSVGNG